jgi:hypothetical protein
VLKEQGAENTYRGLRACCPRAVFSAHWIGGPQSRRSFRMLQCSELHYRTNAIGLADDPTIEEAGVSGSAARREKDGSLPHRPFRQR